MEKLSKDMEPNDAIIRISELSTEAEVKAFIAGEEREAVLTASVARYKELEAASEGGSPTDPPAEPETKSPKSTDCGNVKEANAALAKLTTKDEINAFIEGETRKTYLAAANALIDKLEKPKAGETGAITEKTDDFKDGVNGTKDSGVVTCADIIPGLREQGMKI